MVPDSVVFYGAVERLTEHIQKVKATKDEQARYKLPDGTVFILLWMKKRHQWKVVFPDRRTEDRYKDAFIWACSKYCGRELSWDGDEKSSQQANDTYVVIGLLMEIRDLLKSLDRRLP